MLDNQRACNLLRRNEFSILTNTAIGALYSCTAVDLSLIDSATASRFWARQRHVWWDAPGDLLGIAANESICMKRGTSNVSVIACQEAICCLIRKTTVMDFWGRHTGNCMANWKLLTKILNVEGLFEFVGEKELNIFSNKSTLVTCFGSLSKWFCVMLPENNGSNDIYLALAIWRIYYNCHCKVLC